MKPCKDPITITVLARDMYDAEMAAALYEDAGGILEDWYNIDTWIKAPRKYPVELYLVFPRKRNYNKFLKELISSATAIKIISKYEGRKENE